MTPMPPAWATAMASLPSVTVSMAEDRIGMRTEISLVMREPTSVSAGMISEAAGTSSTSSKVRPRLASMMEVRAAMIVSLGLFHRGVEYKQPRQRTWRAKEGCTRAMMESLPLDV